jgi:branched-chain amino acid transport system ATP-binding protein
MALLEVDGLVAGFGPTTVLHGVDLAVEADELSAVLGLNGAGKSVTMKVVGGLVPARSGRVTFAGEDITGLSVEQRVARGMAFVPQGRQLFPDLSVTENLRLGGYLPRRRDRAASDKVMASVFERFPRLAERRDQAAGTMSGGEQAMLAVARALMGQPKLLLVDEPSAGLSPLVAAQVFDLLDEVHRSGVAVLLVEQNVPLALRVADRVNVMQRGRVVMSSPKERVDHDQLAAELGIGRLLAPRVSSNGHGEVRRPRKTAAKKTAAKKASR